MSSDGGDEDEARRHSLPGAHFTECESSSAPADATSAVQRCPCCRHRTLAERGGFEICAVCFWEDDGQDDHDANAVRGGPNGSLSLTEARRNYLRIGACEDRAVPHVRKPRPDEE